MYVRTQGYGGGVHTQNGHVLVQHDLEAMHREKMLAAQNHTRQDMGHHRSYPNRAEQHRHHYVPPQPPPPQMASRVSMTLSTPLWPFATSVVSHSTYIEGRKD